MNKGITAGVLLVLVLGAGYWYMNSSVEASPVEPSIVSESSVPAEEENHEAMVVESAGTVKAETVKSATPSPTPKPSAASTPKPTTSGSSSGGASSAGSASQGSGVTTSVETSVVVQSPSVREITISGNNFSFSPSSFSVKKGDRVRVTFKNTGGSHDVRVEGYDVGSKIIGGGQEDVFEFTADKAGNFEYFCSVGSHRAMGMKGTLTVTE